MWEPERTTEWTESSPSLPVFRGWKGLRLSRTLSLESLYKSQTNSKLMYNASRQVKEHEPRFSVNFSMFYIFICFSRFFNVLYLCMAHFQCIFSILAQANLCQSHCTTLCRDSPTNQFSLVSQSLSLIFSSSPGYSQHFPSPSGSLGLLVHCASLSGYGTKGLWGHIRASKSVVLDEGYRSPTRRIISLLKNDSFVSCRTIKVYYRP